MSNFENTDGRDFVGQFVLSELRDIRKSQEERDRETQRLFEQRDQETRAVLSQTQASIAALTEAVTGTQTHRDAMQKSIDSIIEKVTDVRTDLDELISENDISRKVASSRWDGPKSIMRTVIFVGSTAAAVAAIISIAPHMGTIFTVGQ
jgi:uncharacterized coiled-coil protein SlyX